MYNTYIPLLTYKHANGAEGSEVDPRPRREPAEDQQRRQDLHADPAQGPQVLRRHPGQGLRLHLARSNASSRSTRGGSPFYTGIVGAEKFAETKTGGIPGIKTDDKTGEIVIDLTKPRGTFTNELALMFVGAACPPGTPDEEPLDRPAPGDRPLHDHQVRTRPRLVLRAQPALGESQRQSDAGPARRPRRQDRDHDHPQRLDPGQRNRTGQVRLDADAAARRPLHRSQGQIRGHPVPGRAPDQHLLLLDEHDTSRRSTTSRSARRSTTRSTRRRWNGSTPARSSARQQILPRGDARATRSSTSTRTTWPKRSRLIKEANPADTRHHRLDRQRKPQRRSGRLLQRRAQQTRLQRRS